jgi:hypothetical protein
MGRYRSIQEKERRGVVIASDVLRILYSRAKWCIDFEISLNNL